MPGNEEPGRPKSGKPRVDQDHEPAAACLRSDVDVHAKKNNFSFHLDSSASIPAFCTDFSPPVPYTCWLSG